MNPEAIRIPCRTLTMTLELKSTASVSSFPASTIRGGFGYTLKRLVCGLGRKSCDGCILKCNCAYPFLFETAPGDDATRLKRYVSIPRPFAIRPRQEGDRVIVELLLIGNAVEMLPFFVLTFIELGKNGLGKHQIPFMVQSVTTWDGEKIYASGNDNGPLRVGPLILSISPGERHTGTVTLRFVSPLVLRKEGKIISYFDTRAFFTTLLRRITNCNAFYGLDRDLEVDPAPYLAAADAMTCETDMRPLRQQRVSTRQQQRIDYSGLVGSVKLHGDIGTVLPLLRAGEVLGVGKNTVFGQGVFRVGGGENGYRLLANTEK